MLVVAAGMMRSGSTWQYQVACDLTAGRGPTHFLGYIEKDDFTKAYNEIANAEGIFVVKMHPPHQLVAELAEQGRAKILYCFRDVRDVVYSVAHKLMIQPSQAMNWYLPATLESHRFWMNCSNRFAMRYENFVTDRLAALRAIAEFLEVSVSVKRLVALDQQYNLDANRKRANAKKLLLEQSGCDLSDAKYVLLHHHEELVHWNHVRPDSGQRWSQLATGDQLTEMARVCGDWLIENGYEPDQLWAAQASNKTRGECEPGRSCGKVVPPRRAKISIESVRSWPSEDSKSTEQSPSRPMFSVVIPTCGRVPLLAETLNSLVCQSYPNFEVVVTDDSPKEEDRQSIRQAVQKFTRSGGHGATYVHSRPGLQQAANTNQGLSTARGELLRILHSDDLLRHDALEQEAALFEREPRVDVLFEDCLPFTDQVDWDRDPQPTLIHPAHHLRNELSHATALPSGLVFRRHAIERTGLMDERYRFLCDWEFFYRLLVDQIKQRKLVARFSAGLVGWRTHINSVTGKLRRVHCEEHERFINEVLSNTELEEIGAMSAEEKAHFAHRALHYRYHRLWDDFRQAPWAVRWNSAKWMLQQFRGPGRRLLRKRLARSVERSVRNFVRGPKKLKAPAPFDPAIAAANRRTFRTLGENAGTLAIMPFYDTAIVSSHPKSIQLDYDNSIRLWPHREEIARARPLRLFFVNYNRMYERVLHEVLKYITLGQEVEIILGGNEHLQWFGLKAVVDRLFPGQFELSSQENIAGDFYSIAFRRQQPAPIHLLGEHTGWTFGLLTLGQDPERVFRYIRSIEAAKPDRYEVVVVAPTKLEFLDGIPNCRQINFSERDDLGWITRKKNLICQGAEYSDILICHDRFALTPSYFADWSAAGYCYGIAAPRVRLTDGRRALDWAVASSQNNTWSHGGLLDYRSYSSYVYVPGGATAVRKAFWQQFPWNENLYWNEHEDVELCRRAQRNGEIVSLGPATLITTSDRWIDQNPLLPFDPYCESLFGGPVGEQRIHYLPMPTRAA
jgi:glycosyltransferase involved in cell wall biosynthesis